MLKFGLEELLYVLYAIGESDDAGVLAEESNIHESLLRASINNIRDHLKAGKHSQPILHFYFDVFC